MNTYKRNARAGFLTSLLLAVCAGPVVVPSLKSGADLARGREATPLAPSPHKEEPKSVVGKRGQSGRASAQSQALQEHRQLLRVFVDGDDIYPDQIRLRPGKVLLVCENQTQKDISLVVEKANPGQAAESVAHVATREIDIRNRQELTLGAGQYVFYEQSHPQLKGRITVDPHGN